MQPLFDQVERYLRLIEGFHTKPRDFEPLLHADFVQTELPNTLNPRGQQSDRAGVLARLSVARQILAEQSFEIGRHCEDERHLFVEAVWRGTMAVDAGPLKRGQTMTAYFCMVFEFKDGLIWRQRNYDCFEPLAPSS